MATKRTEPDHTRISFRLPPDIADELARRAAEVGKSPGLYARELLHAALFEHEEQRQELRAIRADVAKLAALNELTQELRDDIATSVRVLLSKAGRLSPGEARRWVERRFFPPTNNEVPPCSQSD